MTLRTSRFRVLAPLLALAAGCQDYNFNPVGHCLIQPGSERVTLSNLATADILFVIDDSGSMAGEQDRLVTGFSAFIGNLDAFNVNRVAVGLEPLDFHVAITTSSIFLNTPTTAVCRTDCPQASGQNVCCTVSGTTPLSPLRVAKACPSGTGCGGGTECREDCVGFLGERMCCDPGTKAAPATEPITCTTEGAACGRLETHYRFNGTCGIAQSGARFPQGDFVAAPGNPRVLHFDKELYPSPTSPANPKCPGGTCNKQGFTSAQLQEFFRANAVVGTCGSGQEQGLQAGRLAVQKALARTQLDTYDASGTAASSQAQWPHDESRLVVVFLGDEDDCSSPVDPVRGVILSGNPGTDACVNDAALPAAERKQYPVNELVDYFTGLGRPMGAAFIVSTQNATCEDASCSPGTCCDTTCTGDVNVCRTNVCGGQAAGTRFLEAAQLFRARGVDTVVGSMCNNGFGGILSRIADIAKPPSGLVLPSVPASGDITVLRIASAGGNTRKTCRGPAPVGLSAAEATSQGYDWWFTAGREQLTDAQKAPSTATQYVYINHDSRNCEANPGETYSADYLGRLPEGGCQSDADCANKLGGRTEDWTCFSGVDQSDRCIAPTAANAGTCLCGGRAAKCPNGSL